MKVIIYKKYGNFVTAMISMWIKIEKNNTIYIKKK